MPTNQALNFRQLPAIGAAMLPLGANNPFYEELPPLHPDKPDSKYLANPQWPNTLVLEPHTYVQSRFMAEEAGCADLQKGEAYLVFKQDGKLGLSCDAMADVEGINPAILVSLGWVVIDGLKDVLCDFSGGYTLTLPYHGKHLVIPAGLWPIDLPQRVARGEFTPDDKWQDIFDVNAGYLAWSLKDRGVCERLNVSHGYDVFQFGDVDAWRFHQSWAGVSELLSKKYGVVGKIAERADVVVISVPKRDMGCWIGKEGRQAKILQKILGKKVNIRKA